MKHAEKEKILAILAGGRATRFSGVEKLKLEIDGMTILERILTSLFSPGYFDRVYLLIGQKDEETFMPLPDVSAEVYFLKDRIPGEGPLSGLLSVFEASRNSQVFLCAGDMPFPSRELMMRLHKNLFDRFLISVPESRRGIEPLFGWYSSELYPVTLSAVKKGNARVVSIFEEGRTKVLPVSEVEKVCDPDLCFFNINTERDYQRAQEIAANFRKGSYENV